MENAATYTEARSEYTKHLAMFIVPAVVKWFRQAWARNSVGSERNAMYHFQTELEEITRWNQDRINDEVRAFVESTGCDYIEELITAVFVAHTKVLTAVRLSSKQKKLSITVPKLDRFVHYIFREAARFYWKSPFLFVDTGNTIERQKNVLQIEALAAEAITVAVRSLLPVKQILQEYLGDETEEVEDDMPIPEPEPVAAPTTEVTAPTAAPSPHTDPPAPADPPTTIAAVPPPHTDPPTTPAEPSVPEQPSVPSVIKIDTEAAVRFHDYDAVFDETAGAPEMRYSPKDADADDDMEEADEDVLDIDEKSVTDLSEDDAEDLEAPVKKPDAPPPVTQPPATTPPAVFNENIEADEITELE